ncbi:MAG: peptidase domain-containing ABC transporter [Synechococcales cyanobacterium T60_A2020_003]|nr:peptidase domain-containing ABC transporter [Synechococcales cyanobacterium T60_A2020_003]
MTYTKSALQEFLGTIPPFDRLPDAVLTRLAEESQLLRYRMGQPIVVRDTMPAQVSIIHQGQARFLGYDPRTERPVTLELMKSGAVLGWLGLVRGVPCETAIASTETICLTIPASEFLGLLTGQPAFANILRSQCSLIETFDLLGAELHRRAIGDYDLKELTLRAQPEAVVKNLSPGAVPLTQLERDRLWFVSGGGAIANFEVGSCIDRSKTSGAIDVVGSFPARVIGIPEAIVQSAMVPVVTAEVIETNGEESATATAPGPSLPPIPIAPDRPPEGTPFFVEDDRAHTKSLSQYPFVRGRGEIPETIACFQMLGRYLHIPFRRDVIERALRNQLQRTGGLSLDLLGSVAEFMGLHAQLVSIPVTSLGRLEAPAIIQWKGKYCLLYDIDERDVVIAVPDQGVQRIKTEKVSSTWGTPVEAQEGVPAGERGDVLMLTKTKQTPEKRFGLDWFLPSLVKYKRVLIEVFIASFFVQLFALANPLMIQIIIDKVIVQNSTDTLQVLGIFLLVLAIFEAVLSSLRTYLFVDTTNRIDMALGSQIIDHLLRLPLRYFEKRPVGELSTRINELENIRQFLTGTALTVVLDAVFSVIYIVVMFVYSWLLTIVSLAIVPLFVGLAVVASPLIRQQLRVKAERNAETQSHLVEVISGIQTVKAQNMELRARWQWQERYARYISAGFKTVLTSTTAGSASNFLNKLSALLVLWVGAYLVLKGQLTLGQLIAFRIISGYVTSPLLRLAQLWQSFQEVGLSIERLSDIVDTQPEADELDRLNIPMPPIQGDVKFDEVFFRFAKTGPYQLNGISVEFERGSFVGIVGLSGSGKSTMMKLLPRLYDLESGRILIDGYDISKVELYSLRQQVGIVPQDTLLFDGTVQDNIALTCPNATAEEIIEAARIAAAHDFVMGLPQGYNTRVGERGSALSGGQRQRIAIARTVLQNPRILILDEATSALDYDSERQVCLNLAEKFRDRTVFFITHRLSTIKNADVILMMDKGHVVEQGTHDDLMALRGRYYCLYQQQEAQM